MNEETPIVTRDWCPVCAPDVDPLRELVTERWCYTHMPGHAGSADVLVPPSSGTFGAAFDVEGDENRQRCALIHRRETP